MKKGILVACLIYQACFALCSSWSFQTGSRLPARSQPLMKRVCARPWRAGARWCCVRWHHHAGRHPGHQHAMSFDGTGHAVTLSGSNCGSGLFYPHQYIVRHDEYYCGPTETAPGGSMRTHGPNHPGQLHVPQQQHSEFRPLCRSHH